MLLRRGIRYWLLLIYKFIVTFICSITLFCNMFLCFWDTVIDFELTRCQRQVFSNAENVIQNFSVGRKDSE